MPTVSSAYLKNYLDTCVAHGAPESDLLGFVPGGREALDHPDRRFKASAVVSLLDHAAAVTGNDALGIHVGLGFRPSSFLDVGYALGSASTIREALTINARYQALTQEIVRTSLKVSDGLACIRCEPVMAGEAALRRVMEAVFAGYAAIGYFLLRDQRPPIELMQFRHHDPGARCQEAYRAVFGDKVRFGAREDMLVFREEIVSLPLPGANPELVQVLTRRLDARLKALRRGASLTEQVRNCLHTQLRAGRPNVERTAELVGVSDRTLRRRLAAEGTSFGDLLLQARKEAADIYLRQPELSLTEIALALGYGDQSAFVRAFRGWNDISPGAYRRRILGNGSAG